MLRTHRIVLSVLLFSSLFLIAFRTEAEQYPPSTYQELRWRMVGPFRGGRTRAAVGVPSQPNVFYIGQVNGGVWKSEDYGRTWNPIFDEQPTQSIGAIAVAPSDPNVIYVGSGEGLHRPDLSVGNGIYRSTDAGKSWTHLGLHDSAQIPALLVDPRDPNRVFAAVLGRPYGPSSERGIFRSTDGGANWQRVLYKDENTGGSDIAIDPSNPNTLYASLWEVREGPWEDNNILDGTGGGLFKSTDGGTTWRQLGKGLPKDFVEIHIAIASSQPRRLYATLGASQRSNAPSKESAGVFRSDDAGENWYRVTGDPRPAGRIGGGDLSVPKVDPKNADVIYVASTVTMRSEDGGKTWAGFRGAPGGDDYQNLWINPNNPDIILLVSDQGAVVTVNGGQTWSSWYNQPTAQLYHVSATNGYPYRVCGGQQESGSVCISNRGNDGEITERDWHPVGVIEYGYVAPDPLDPDVIYGGGRSEVTKFHISTGQVQNVTPIPVKDAQYRTDRTEPTKFSPVDPHILYYACNILFKTTDGGNSWQAISSDLTRPDPGAPPSMGSLLAKNPAVAKQRGVIYSLAPSFKTVNTLWAGTDDGLIWITRDGGKNWANITPPDLTPWSKVTQIEASHFDEQTAYASVSRFRIDDLHPYIYRTHDGGRSWQLIVNGLPDGPVDTVREDPIRKGLLFVGTENSVWMSFDDGDTWQSLQLNLPHTSMRDLWIHDDDLIVATHGRAFWILDDITPLRQLNSSVPASNAFLFKPGVAYRIRRSTYTDTPLPPDEPTAQNPPDGAVIDYFLSQASTEPVAIEILDGQGKLVRRYSSADKPEQTEEELEKQLIPLYWIRMPKTVSTEAGMHRWIWDLHYPPPTSIKHQYPISAVPHDTPRDPLGPRVLPGEYTVRLTAGGSSFTVPLTVKLDPRVKTPPAGLQQMFGLQTRLANLLTASSEATTATRSLQQQLDQLAGKASGPAADAIEKFKPKLKAVVEGAAGPAAPNKGPVAAPAAPSPSMQSVNTAVSALYAEVDRVDAAPTMAQFNATAALERDSSGVIKLWETLKTTDLPALNEALRGAGLPELSLEAPAEAAPDLGDEE